MKCNYIEPLIYLVREGELTEDEKKQLNAHLEVCESCRKKYEMAMRMTSLVRQSARAWGANEPNNTDTDQIMRAVEKAKNTGMPNLHRGLYLPLIKGIAASILVIIASNLAYQEFSFYKNKSELELRVQQTDNLSGTEPGNADCVNKLKRKYRAGTMTFIPQKESLVMNRISEEQLTRYVQEVCGSDARDINKMKSLLMQAGLIKMNHVN